MSDKREPLAKGIATGPVEFEVGDAFGVRAMSFFPILEADEMPQAQFDGALVHIHIGDPAGQSVVMGNAAMVAPGIALGARHVVHDYLTALVQGDTKIWATAIGQGGRLDLWKVRHITPSPHSDLAIFSLVRASAMPPDNTLNVVSLSTKTPALDEPVMVVGFRWDAGLAKPGEAVVTGNVRGAVGLVSDHYPEGADRIFLPGPGIGIRVGTYQGMSGGPAFDIEGNLVGVLSSGFGDGDSSEGPSLISLAYPALTQSFLSAWPSGLYPPQVDLLGLDRRICPIVGADRLQRVVDINGNSGWIYTR